MKFLYSLLLFIPSFLFGQTKVEEQYYDSLYKPVLVKEHAKYLMRTTFNDTFPNKWMKEKIDVLDSNHINTVIYKDYYTAVNSDTFKTSISYFENKSIESIISYKNKKNNGIFMTFYKNGNIKRIDTFENNKLISGKCFKLNGGDTSYFNYSISPEFKGGIEVLYQFLSKNLIYPEFEKDNEIEEIVYVIFVIEKDGTITEITTDKRYREGFENNAKALIKKTAGYWIPGTQDGKPVRVKVKLPIEFSLE